MKENKFEKEEVKEENSSENEEEVFTIDEDAGFTDTEKNLDKRISKDIIEVIDDHILLDEMAI